MAGKIGRRGMILGGMGALAGLGTLSGAGWAFRAGLRGSGIVRPAWTLPLPRPILVAHRGGAHVFPENTLHAFRGSAERFGCRFLELDVRATADGVPVVIHDADVARTTDGQGQVHRMSLDAVQALDAAYRFAPADQPNNNRSGTWAGRGIRIPTLAAVLQALPQPYFSIEVKQHDPPCEAQVIDVIRQAGAAGRVVLGTTRAETFRRIHALAPEIPSFFTFRAGVWFYVAQAVGLDGWYRPPHNALMVPERAMGRQVITPEFLAAARRLHLPVLVWTVNERADMARLLDLGVDGIITDRPDRMAALLREREPPA